MRTVTSARLAPPTDPSRSGNVTVGRRTIRLTHPDRVVFPDLGITKAELVDYYRRVAPVMVPFLRGRPLMLQRLRGDLPSGQLFYQKEAPGYFPSWIRRVTVSNRGGTVTHAICDDAAGLVYLANQGVITPHPWLARADDPDRPDRLVFDLDPSVDALDEVRFAARAVGDLLREVGLQPFLMATGSRGFHVVAAIRREEPFPIVNAIAAALAEALADRAPDRLTTEFSKAGRGTRVFIDYHRNMYAQTAVPPYAVRPRPGAPVATPLAWEELDRARPDGWSIRAMLDRLDRTTDPWSGFGRHPRSIDHVRRWLERRTRRA